MHSYAAFCVGFIAGATYIAWDIVLLHIKVDDPVTTTSGNKICNVQRFVVYILHYFKDPTETSCEKCNSKAIGENRTYDPANLVRRSANYIQATKGTSCIFRNWSRLSLRNFTHFEKYPYRLSSLVIECKMTILFLIYPTLFHTTQFHAHIFQQTPIPAQFVLEHIFKMFC